MTFRIQTSVNEKTVTFAVSGKLGVEGVTELNRLLNGCRDDNHLVVDLQDVGLIDRYAIRSLAAFEGGGVRLINCPPYVRDSIVRKR